MLFPPWGSSDAVLLESACSSWLHARMLVKALVDKDLGLGSDINTRKRRLHMLFAHVSYITLGDFSGATACRGVYLERSRNIEAK
jgi:hypothetical protein